MLWPTSLRVSLAPDPTEKAAESVLKAQNRLSEAACSLHIMIRSSSDCDDPFGPVSIGGLMRSLPSFLKRSKRPKITYGPVSRKSKAQSVQPDFIVTRQKHLRALPPIEKDYHGIVPQTIEELVTLPGVGRKTANVVLGNAFGIVEGIVVDTHVGRISRKLGLTESSDPGKVERDLMALVPRQDWVDFSHRMISLGRETCRARNPLCGRCPLRGDCPSASK